MNRTASWAIASIVSGVEPPDPPTPRFPGGSQEKVLLARPSFLMVGAGSVGSAATSAPAP
ncbi:hypothetical protein GCM10010255_39700 [Streptomyces coeruleofuscus]|uniref:Uncharacterized protein n=1 Tax=Streptomyces coeruleofuscus TaxID=66879 RepID=A0ABP5VHF2_9ACTN